MQTTVTPYVRKSSQRAGNSAVANGDGEGYTMHLWFVVPEKAYNEK